MQVRFLSSAVMGGMIIHPAFFIAVLPWGIFRLTAYGGPKWAGGQQGRFQPIVFVLSWQHPGRAEQAGRGCARSAFSLFNSHERCLCTIDGFAQHTYSFFIKSYNSTWILPRGYGTMKSDKNLTYVVCARGFFPGRNDNSFGFRIILLLLIGRMPAGRWGALRIQHSSDCC